MPGSRRSRTSWLRCGCGYGTPPARRAPAPPCGRRLRKRGCLGAVADSGAAEPGGQVGAVLAELAAQPVLDALAGAGGADGPDTAVGLLGEHHLGQPPGRRSGGDLAAAGIEDALVAGAVQLALGAPVLAPEHGAGEVGADRGVADEGAVVEPDGDRAVLLVGVVEGDGLAGEELGGDLLRGGGLAVLVGVAVAGQDAAGDAEAPDGEPARHGGDDAQVVPAGGEGVGGDPVVQGLARVPGGRLSGRAGRRTAGSAGRGLLRVAGGGASVSVTVGRPSR